MADNEKITLKKYRSSDKFKNWQKEYRKKRQAIPEVHEREKFLKRENAKKNIITRMLKAAKTRAEKYNIEFSLKREDIVIPETCSILEIPLFAGSKENYQNSPSIDRIDNTLGYTKDNICIISNLANTMKNCATKEQLLKFCKNIPNYLKINDIVQTTENKESVELKDKEPLG